MNRRRKICLVVQRYGPEVNGGAELLTRAYAERLKDLYDTDIATTKALDYMTWADWYTEDTEVIGGVTVHRFSVREERVMDRFHEINAKFVHNCMEEGDEQIWIDRQGPLVPQMIEWLKEHESDYDCFLFFTYLYYQSVMGVPALKDKAVLVPFAHDEPFLKMEVYRKLFTSPKAILFSTEEERHLIRTKFRNYRIPCLIGGSGVDVPQDISADRFRTKYGLDSYMLYIGRIDTGKNCEELFDFFVRYKEENPSSLKLVLMGREVIPVPQRDDIVSLGFVSEQDKYDGLAGCRFLVLSSLYESLSMVVLEAFAVKKPVLVNRKCEVLKAHCDKSGGGRTYETYEEFAQAVNACMNDAGMCADMGEKGYVYVQENYRWDVIMRKISALIEYTAEGNE